MPRSSAEKGPRRHSVNLSIREDIVADAKALRQAHAEKWRRENRAALDAHNDRIERDGVLLTPDWASDR